MFQVLPGKAKDGFLNTKRITRPMCDAHFMENTFGLWPYHCTLKCYKAVQERSDIVLHYSDTTVWVDMKLIFSRPKVEPKCPWCSKPMKAGEAEDAEAKVQKPKGKSVGHRSRRS